MKTAKQTVTTEFEPIELNESVKVSFERNVAGDKTITLIPQHYSLTLFISA